jgi:hypothetical protein
MKDLTMVIDSSVFRDIDRPIHTMLKEYTARAQRGVLGKLPMLGVHIHLTQGDIHEEANSSNIRPTNVQLR